MEKKPLPLKHSDAKNRREEMQGLHHEHQDHHLSRQHEYATAHGQQQQKWFDLKRDLAHGIISSGHCAPHNKFRQSMAIPKDGGACWASSTTGRCQTRPSLERDRNNRMRVTFTQPQATTRTHTISDHIKDSRLLDSDLYVTRLSWQKQPPTLSSPLAAPIADSSSTSPFSSSSLHDKLRLASPKIPSTTPQIADRATATQSRPCYRCIYYMHSAGIKRVFWKNN